MSKKNKCIIAVASILVVIAIGVGVGLGVDSMLFEKEHPVDCFSVSINAEYKEKFLAEEFTLEDFKWDNVESIKYITWFDERNNVKAFGVMTVYLKKPGKWRLKRAIKHFETLDFVNFASTQSHMHAD